MLLIDIECVENERLVYCVSIEVKLAPKIFHAWLNAKAFAPSQVLAISVDMIHEMNRPGRMIMHVTFDFAKHTSSMAPVTAYIRPTVRESERVSASATVSLSRAAQQLSHAASNSAALSDQAAVEKDSVAGLKGYLKGIDFKSVSPLEMNDLAVRLVKSGELTADQASAFMGIDLNTEPPRSADQKMNIVDHFNMMYDVVSSAARNDATLRVGVSWRQESIDTLNAIRSFASSNRSHILGK